MPNSDEPRPQVTHCICGMTSFARLKELGVSSLDEAAEYGCGVKCRSCRPYLLKMFETGETSIDLMDV